MDDHAARPIPAPDDVLRLCAQCGLRPARFWVPTGADPLAFLVEEEPEDDRADTLSGEWLCTSCVASLLFDAPVEEIDDLLFEVARRTAARRLIDTHYPPGESPSDSSSS
jgi:hypothetical protein